MPVAEPAVTQPSLGINTRASMGAPFVNPDVLMPHPAPLPNVAEAAEDNSVQQRTAEAPSLGAGELGGDQPPQEFQGDMMTFNEAKGWERVAAVRSRGWPAGVPVPQCAPSPTPHIL